LDHLELRIDEDVPGRDRAEALVREQAAKLERHTDNVTSCHVAIERPHAHPQSGSDYRVRVEVRLAGQRPFTVRREPGDGEIHDDLSVAIHDAFASADRKARELHRQQQDHRPSAGQQQVGVVRDVEDDFATLLTPDGRQVFVPLVVSGGDAALEPGMAVAFQDAGHRDGQSWGDQLSVLDARTEPPFGEE